MRQALFALALVLPFPALADPDHAAIAERALAEHILPGFEALAAETAGLGEAAARACSGGGPIELAPVDAAYHATFDAWVAVSHLRFGPTEENDAGFSIAFWPDARGATPRTLTSLVAAEDPIVDDPEAFRTLSVAGRGLFALDHLLFDPDAAPIEAGTYPCRLLTAITADLAATADGILARWRDPYAAILTSAGAPDNPVYFAPAESTRELYSALSSGLEATADLRLGRPLGTAGHPQPRRAEAWRSGRPLRNVALSLAELRDFAETAFLPEVDPEGAERVRRAFGAAEDLAARIDAPIAEALSTPQGRLRVEALSQAVGRARDAVAAEIGAEIGVTAGFNSMDGD